MTHLENWISKAADWQPGKDWISVGAIDAHTAGEPLRIFTDGFPQPSGKTILEKRQDAQRRLEMYRTGTMWEPRGHADMYGCLIVPPERKESDFGVLFLHNEGYSSMCGHGIIAVATVAVEVGWIPPVSPYTSMEIDAPAGLIKAEVHVESGRVNQVSFENVPSFVVELDESVDVPGFGEIKYDLSFGGAYYAFVDVSQIGLELTPENASQLIMAGRAIKTAVKNRTKIQHPDQPDLSFLYGTIFTGPPLDTANHSRHVCIFADGELDRSPTGTGVSARVALLAARGQLVEQQRITIESILGTSFDVAFIDESTCGTHDAVIPKVWGRAHITGRNEFWFDPRDELRQGFFLR